MDNLLLLPVDILVNIFKRLKLSDLCNVMLTCKALRFLIVNDNAIWRSVCKYRLILHNSQDNSQKYRFSWYNHCRISHNWCSGYYRSKLHRFGMFTTDKAPARNSVDTLFKISTHSTLHKLYAMGSFPQLRGSSCLSRIRAALLPKRQERPAQLQGSSMETVPKIQRHDVRTNDISRFIIKDKLLVCGNRDGCVAVYKFNDIYRRPKLQSHIENCHENGQVEVTAVELIKTKQCKTVVITGSNDSSNIMFWHLLSDEDSENEIMNAPNGYHSNTSNISQYESIGIRCLSMNSGMDKLAIGLNGNSKPHLLDVNNGRLLLSAGAGRDAKQAVRDIRWHGDHCVAYVTHSGLLRLVDTRSYQQVFHARDPFQSSLYCVKSDGERAVVVGSSEYSRCVLFDLRNSTHHVQMYFTQRKTSPVYSLDFDATKLITAVDRGIAVLNFNIDTSTVEQRDYSHVFY